jgi:hypothetical protein
MKRQILFWTLSLVLCIIAGGTLVWNTYVPDGEFRVSQEEVQSYLDEHLPQTDTWMEITDASLEFKKNTLRTAVSLHTDEFAGHAYSVLVFTEGRPRYKPSEGSFYFDVTNVMVEIQPLTEDVLIREKTSCAIPLSLYRIRNLEDLRTTVLLKAEEFMRTLMRRMIISGLQKTPVYELPASAEGIAVAVFLEEVAVEDGEVVFSVTFWRALWLAVFACLALVTSIAILAAMVRNPLAVIALVVVCVFGT